MPQQYLSTDPNAGRSASPSSPGDYLSTDPNAGEREPPMTRERQAPSTKSALESGHHPDSLVGGAAGSREIFGRRVPSIFEVSEDDIPSDAAFMKRGPEVGSIAGMTLGGPVGAGVGAALGSLAKGQQAQGAHVPTRGDVGGAVMEGGLSGLIAGAPLMAVRAGRAVGPALTNNARKISTAIRGVTGAGPLAGGGAWYATGNPLIGAVTSAASRALTSPQAVKAAGTAATTVGRVPEHAANKLGFGVLAGSTDAYRQALLDALGSEQP